MLFAEVMDKIFNNKKGDKHFIMPEIVQKYNLLDDEIQYLHLVGTNGKGSTAKLINDTLIKNGNKVGLFTSPSFYVHNDRIRINNENISDDELVDIFKDWEEVITSYDLGFFEIFFLLSLVYFKNQKVEYAIIEAGIGGKYDATNCLKNSLAILTNVGIDHSEQLGNSLEEITEQKTAVKENARVFFTTEKLAIPYLNKIESYYIETPYVGELSLLGSHQKMNAALAQAVLQFLGVDHEIIKSAFTTVVWEGRLQKIAPNIIIDGAHNLHALESLGSYLATLDNLVVMFAVSKERDYLSFYDFFKQYSDEVYYVKNDFFNRVVPEEMIECDLTTYDFKDDYNYVITGSIYMISEVEKWIRVGKRI